MSRSGTLYSIGGLALLLVLACGAPSVVSQSAGVTQPASPAATPSLLPVTGATDLPIAVHLSQPADIGTPKQAALIYDVDSSGTGPEKRAPYGDSYGIDRFERPFQKDMTYVPDLDILTFSLAQDEGWNYVSIQLVGADPNNPIGIDYAVELDTNGDGFGDYLISAQPPYTAQWETGIVRVFQDTNHDVGAGPNGPGNGYDTLLFNGGTGKDADPDLAWARMQAGEHATIQFAFKASWLGPSFAFGVVADAGLKDAAKFEYSSRFSQADAGSPVRSSKYYPLGSLYAIDNTCLEANHLPVAGNELMFCPAAQPAAKHKGGNSCTPLDPTVCGGPAYYDPSSCQCKQP